MSYVLRLATDATRDLVVEALRAEASKRTRVASGAAQHVAADRMGGRDVRSASVKVAMLLAEAAELGALADELATAEALPVITGPVPTAEEDLARLGADGVDLTKLDDPTPLDVAAAMLGTPAPPDEEDDGLSPAAHAALAQAAEFEEQYLTDPDGSDVDTGATAEDEPGDDDVEEALR